MKKKHSEQSTGKFKDSSSSDEFKITEIAQASQFFKPKAHENYSVAYRQLLATLQSILNSNSSLKAIKKSFVHEAKVLIPRLNNREHIEELYDLLNKLNTDFGKIRERRHFKSKGQYTDTNSYKRVVEFIKNQTQKLVDNNPVLSQEQEELAKTILGFGEEKSASIVIK